MAKKAKATQPRKRVAKAAPKKNEEVKEVKTEIVENPPQKEKTHKRVTVILPREIVIALKKRGIEREQRGRNDNDLSCMIREAIDAFLKSQK